MRLLICLMAIILVACSAPDPTPTPDPYMARVSANVAEIDEQLDALSPLLQNADPTDQEWLSAIGTRIGLIQMTHDHLVGVEPPGEMAGFHQGVLSVTDACYRSMELLSAGIDGMNRAVIDEAGALLADCRSGITELQNSVRP